MNNAVTHEKGQMELPLAHRADPTLQYQPVAPEASHNRFVAFVARTIAVASIFVALYPLGLAIARLIPLRPNYAQNYSYYAASRFGGYAYGSSPAVLTLLSGVMWFNGIAGLLIVVSAMGTLIRKNVMRLLLALSLFALFAGMLFELLLRQWPLVRQFFSSRGSGLGILLLILPGFGLLIFPVAAGAILSHPSFRMLNRARPESLPSGAQMLCYLSIIFGGIGIIFRPLAILAVLGETRSERAPLGLVFLAISGSGILVWHALTRLILFGCNVVLLLASIRVLRGHFGGAKMMIRQAAIAFIINGVEIVLIVVLLIQVAQITGVVYGAFHHLLFILPGTALDLAICIYFSRTQLAISP